MQSILNLCGCYGLPLCVSGITHRLALSMEMADHDRRRETVKRQISQGRDRFEANQEMGTQRNFGRVLEEVKEVEASGDLDHLSYTSCIAKAA